MPSLLDDYLLRGYSDIVLINSESHEEKDFHGTERGTETVVARKGALFIRASGFEQNQYGPGGNSYCEIRGEEEITREEYERLSSGRSTLDTSEERQKYIARKASEDMRAQLEKDAPACPEHGVPMKLRKGPNQFFFVCPKCSYKARLSPQQKALANSVPSRSKSPLT